MTYPKRSRKSFTLLELLVAFIIMAILAAVAVPSLLGLVDGSQQTADGASAIGLVDQLYYTALSTNQTTPVDYTSLIGTHNIVAEFEDSGFTIPYVNGDGGTIYFQFGDPIYAQIDVGSGYATANAPSLQGETSSSGSTTTTTAPSIGAPTDVVAAFSGFDIYGNELYNVSWTPGTGSDGSAVYYVGTDIGAQSAPANTCSGVALTGTSCVLAMSLDHSIPSSFTPNVSETDGAASSEGFGSLVTFTPPAPTNLVVTNNGDGSFTANWTGAYVGDTFNVTVLPDAGGQIYLTCSSPTATSCDITAEQASGTGPFVVEVGEVSVTYGEGTAFSSDTPNP
jgi:type IV pilus assembly protein PilA